MEKFPSPEIANRIENNPQMEIAADLAAKRAFMLDEKNDPNFEIYNKIVAFTENIQSKYRDFKSYELYHLLIGSTSKDPCPNFDFPSDDSIAKFINELYGKFNRKE